MSDVIAAVSTAPQPAAIGILRLSGDGAIAAADRVFAAASGRALADTPARKMVLGALRDTHGRVLDQVLASVATALPPSWPRGWRPSSPPARGRPDPESLPGAPFSAGGWT